MKDKITKLLLILWNIIVFIGFIAIILLAPSACTISNVKEYTVKIISITRLPDFDGKQNPNCSYKIEPINEPIPKNSIIERCGKWKIDDVVDYPVKSR